MRALLSAAVSGVCVCDLFCCPVCWLTLSRRTAGPVCLCVYVNVYVYVYVCLCVCTFVCVRAVGRRGSRGWWLVPPLVARLSSCVVRAEPTCDLAARCCSHA